MKLSILPAHQKLPSILLFGIVWWRCGCGCLWFEPFDSIELRYGCTKSGVSVSKQQGNGSMKMCRMGARGSRGGLPNQVLHHVKQGPTNHEHNLLHSCSLYIPTLDLSNITHLLVLDWCFWTCAGRFGRWLHSSGTCARGAASSLIQGTCCQPGCGRKSSGSRCPCCTSKSRTRLCN